MKLVCKLIRPNGTVVTLGTNSYHFKPDESGLHVCEVTDTSHIKALLNVPEAYYEHGNEAKAAPAVAVKLPDVLVPANMTNGELNAWATEHEFNPKNKKSIATYAKETFGLELDISGNVQCASLIRQVVERSLLVDPAVNTENEMLTWAETKGVPTDSVEAIQAYIGDMYDVELEIDGEPTIDLLLREVMKLDLEEAE